MGNSSAKEEPEPELTKEELEALLRRRGAVVQEILKTEKSYVTSLDVLIKHYKQPLVEAVNLGKPIISKAEIDTIFSNIEELVVVNKKLHLQLDERLVDWDAAKGTVADIFVARAESLKSYTEYVNNYNKSIQTLSKCSSSKKAFKQFLKERFELPESQSQEIQSFLIMPIQRIPRYCLLLQELSKCTRRKHKDFKNVQAALTAVKQVADYINEQKRAFEIVERLYEIQQLVNVKYDLVAEHRKIIRESDVISPKSSKLKYFLFNDSVLVASESSSLLSIWSKRHPYDVVLFDSLRRIEVLDEPDIPPNAWIVSISGEGRNVDLSFPTEDAKQEFIAEFYKFRARAHRLPPLVKKEKSDESPSSNNTPPTSQKNSPAAESDQPRVRQDSLFNRLMK